ncbi:GTP-binding protein [Nitrincola sp. A-D6]|uniref:YdcH family protein n=1 Tax=Nitrincola sp. A-D6 TaxID=1545442 RepID=UPI00051F9468|nr:YdcH family protein [Nitrincola sp. A-D6]KGK40929.1 GTP-binding protein [Nitrincola sp. A-D6]
MVKKHDLIHEFPEFRELIHQMKMENAHFAKLFEEYHQYDNEIRLIENGAEVSSDEYIENLKKHRLSLKDQLYAILKRSEDQLEV